MHVWMDTPSGLRGAIAVDLLALALTIDTRTHLSRKPTHELSQW